MATTARICKLQKCMQKYTEECPGKLTAIIIKDNNYQSLSFTEGISCSIA